MMEEELSREEVVEPVVYRKKLSVLSVWHGGRDSGRGPPLM